MILVDASEGPMPQTKFVLTKALSLNLNPIVIINKIDRSDQRADKVLDDIFDLFVALNANEKQLDFPILFASAKNGWASKDSDLPSEDMTELFDLIINHVPSPQVSAKGTFSLLVTTLENDPYLGRVLTGRIQSGSVKQNMSVQALNREGEKIENTRITKLLRFRGLERLPVEEAHAGDIVAIAGFQEATVSDTICENSVTEPLKASPIDPPTLAMTFSINDSPLAGTEGSKVTSREIWSRLEREAEGNVALLVQRTEDMNAFEVAGRGELQLAVLVETMRREGYELSISRPRVIYKKDKKTGQRLEPIEELIVDVDEEFSGIVVEKISGRKGELKEMQPSGSDKRRLVFLVPSRSLIGYHGEFMTDTRGTGVMNRIFHSYGPFRGPIKGRSKGTLISMVAGKAAAYALWNLEERGPLFIGPGEKTYVGMIIGEHAKGQDLEVNPLKAKQLTNFRASGKDDAVDLTPPIPMNLDKSLAYIGNDELVEVTPISIRLRKRFLDPHERKRHAKQIETA
jgi:GTP-binding protein